ncbi:aldehyde dehydrogenase family protein [Garicola koreensis]|uniref:Aldehyde dehydrogenase (NAD+) n=1 Tax=Garicola koreensis TaxID=1262554 RepID=A0A7W5XZK5_9MICC|nr:aldehyde dehydrogenase family protein [Garicola koreensis]MBB3667551.1 aldehyde dehydrogenase (NAD+) [Garicola koreensis]
MTQDTHPAPAALRLLINGTWQEGTSAALISANPAHPEQTVAEGRQATEDDVDRAFAAAAAAGGQWARTPVQQRGAILLRAAELLEAGAAQFGKELSREEGKTAAEGVGEVRRAAQILRYQAAEGEHQAGEVFHSPRPAEKILVTRKPLGAVGVITPFNFPIAIPAWKIAPALVHGNTVVWKPASTVPLLAMRLAEALHKAGLPDGVLNLVYGSGPLGSAITQHTKLAGLTFTGSTGVGRQLAAAAAGRGVPMQAEMGGKNAALVLADADLETAADQVLLGAFRSTGQKCTATSRLIVDGSVADDLIARLKARLEFWVVGDPTDPEVHMGPLIHAEAAAEVRRGVQAAIDQGAHLIYRGAAPESSGGQDAFLPATILELPRDADAAEANSAWWDEFFGPVLTMRRVSGAQEAFDLANQGEFGLTSAIFTEDVGHILEAMEELDVGILHVNSESAGADPHVPFGGAKGSGYGPKEQGQAAKDFFTHTTTVYLRSGSS